MKRAYALTAALAAAVLACTGLGGTRAVTLPSGTPLQLEIITPVSSRTSRPGDRVLARLAAPVSLGDQVAIPAGAQVNGRVVEAAPVANRVGGRAKLELEFSSLLLPSGDELPIFASHPASGRSQTKNVVAVGTAIAVKNKGDEVVLAEGAVLEVRLDRPVEVRVPSA